MISRDETGWDGTGADLDGTHRDETRCPDRAGWSRDMPAQFRLILSTLSIQPYPFNLPAQFHPRRLGVAPVQAVLVEAAMITLSCEHVGAGYEPGWIRW